MGKKVENLEHPSFGLVSFSRICGRQNFYGSELTQENYIQLLVSESVLQRDITDDKFHRGKELIKVRLTTNQFSELITTMNIGEGVPCTLERIGGKKVLPLPDISNRKEYTFNEFKGRMGDFANNLRSDMNDANKILDKQNITKNDRLEIKRLLSKLITEVTDNIPFFLETFGESMDKVVLDSKQEIHSAIMNKIMSLGLSELQNQKLLENGSE